MERIFTDEDRDWLKQNYPHHSNKACTKHFKCGYEAFKRLVEECGLTYKSSTHVNTKFRDKKETKVLWLDEGATGNFCMDCKRYITGGSCCKKGSNVGALWQKKCFIN